MGAFDLRHTALRVVPSSCGSLFLSNLLRTVPTAIEQVCFSHAVAIYLNQSRLGHPFVEELKSKKNYVIV
jgi:hypothetical protein